MLRGCFAFFSSSLETTFFGGMAAVGVAILGAPVAYPQIGVLPHWLVLVSILMIVVGTAIAHLKSADSSDVEANTQQINANATATKSAEKPVPVAPVPLVK